MSVDWKLAETSVRAIGVRSVCRSPQWEISSPFKYPGGWGGLGGCIPLVRYVVYQKNYFSRQGVRMKEQEEPGKEMESK